MISWTRIRQTSQAKEPTTKRSETNGATQYDKQLGCRHDLRLLLFNFIWVEIDLHLNNLKAARLSTKDTQQVLILFQRG